MDRNSHSKERQFQNAREFALHLIYFFVSSICAIWQENQSVKKRTGVRSANIGHRVMCVVPMAGIRTGKNSSVDDASRYRRNHYSYLVPWWMEPALLQPQNPI